MRLTVLLVETVRDSGSRGLVDDADNVEASNRTGVFRRLQIDNFSPSSYRKFSRRQNLLASENSHFHRPHR